MSLDGRCKLIIGIARQRDSLSCRDPLYPRRGIGKDLDIDAHGIHMVQAICPQIFQLGVGCVIGRQVKPMCETREHFCHRLLDLSKLEVLFKCNDLHLFPVSASTGVLATAADPCSNFTADNAAAKSMVKMLTVASASAILLVCQMIPTASVIAIFVLPTREFTTTVSPITAYITMA